MLLARKNMMGSLSKTQQTSTSITMERSRLVSQRTLATRRQDWAEVKLIDEKLAELAATAPVRVSNETRQDILAKVNERNRKANLEAVRKAEMAEAERKRRERKLLAAGGGTPRSSTPADPAARLKANLLSSRSVSFPSLRALLRGLDVCGWALTRLTLITALLRTPRQTWNAWHALPASRHLDAAVDITITSRRVTKGTRIRGQFRGVGHAVRGDRPGRLLACVIGFSLINCILPSHVSLTSVFIHCSIESSFWAACCAAYKNNI